MGAEDPTSDLDELEVVKGPQPQTCRWWMSATTDQRERVVRNVARIGHTRVAKHLRSKGVKVTSPGIRDHTAGECDKCPIQLTN